MKQSLVIRTHVPISRKYPGVPKVPDHLTAVPMISYREKEESKFVLNTEQARPQYYVQFLPHVPE